MAVVAPVHHVHLMTRFRGQVLARAAVLAAVGLLTWLVPARDGGTTGMPGGPVGSVLTEVSPVAATGLILLLVVIACAWQVRRPADMGALAWVVAGGVLAAASALVVIAVVWGGGPIYAWLALGVVVTSMSVQTVAAVAGHAIAVALQRHRAHAAAG